MVVVWAVENLFALAAFVAKATVFFYHVSLALESLFKLKIRTNSALV